MRLILFSLLIAMSIGVRAASPNLEQIGTRYGIVDVVKHSGRVDIRVQGRVVRSTEVESASLFLVTPSGNPEIVIVDGWMPGPNCHHVFYMVEVYADGKTVASDKFGSCHELQSAKFQGDRLLIVLSDPTILGRDKSSKSTIFEWKNGVMAQVSGDMPAISPSKPTVTPSQTPAKAPSKSAIKSEPSKDGNASIDPANKIYKVSGKGRLPFSSAPEPGREQPGVFIIPGDTVTVLSHSGDYALVHYVNPKNGKSAQGWVLSGHLAEVRP